MPILLIEDNMTIIKGLVYSLEKNNYHVIYKTTLNAALTFLKSNAVDLIILDITLPDGDGFKFYQEKLKSLLIPTIFLTANDNEDKIVACLNEGAEDYLTKPFSTKELMARINKILNRHKNNQITIQDITFDMDKLIVYKQNEVISLTTLELKLLQLLFLNRNKVVTRHTLLAYIYEWTGNDVDDHTITVYLKRIRAKLGTDIITTIKGIGYRIDEK